MTITHGGNLFEICRAHGWDWREVMDLSASINPLGPPPGVRGAVVKALSRVVHYPEKHAPRLVERLAQHWSVDAAQIIAGNGATELIHFLARAWPLDQVRLLAPTFQEYHRAYAVAGPRIVKTLNGLPTVVTQPNNPTGTTVPLEDWLLSTSHPVIVDESFIEFAAMPSVVPLTARRPNLVVLRSMTKFYALPGLRIGALVAHPALAAPLMELREPWQVNVLAEAAALAAIEDTAHARHTRELIAEERAWLCRQLSGMVHLSPSDANFLFARVEGSARAVCSWFLENKVILRDCSGWPGIEGEAVRFAVRTRAENERTVALFREYLCRC